MKPRNLLIASLALLSLFSCNVDLGESLRYERIEAINLEELSGKNDYRCKGSYLYRKDTLVTNFEIDSDFSLCIVKLDSVNEGFNVISEQEASFTGIPGRYEVASQQNYQILFTNKVLKGFGETGTVKISSDGKLSGGRVNDSIHQYFTSFETIVVSFNDDIRGRFHIESKKDAINAEVLLLEKHDELFIFIMNNNKTNKIEKGKLYDYLFKTAG